MLIDLRHEGVSLEDVSAVHEEVEGVLLWELDALADNESELVGCQIAWSKVPVKVSQDTRLNLGNQLTWTSRCRGDSIWQPSRK